MLRFPTIQETLESSIEHVQTRVNNGVDKISKYLYTYVNEAARWGGGHTG